MGTEVHNFEKGRIKALQDERVYIQKKTFTKWANSFLEKVRLEIHDLFTDLADGKLLMKLLEIISGENLGKPNRGILRVQKVENVNRCLTFLATKVHFENIGAEDIVDGNQRLILGLIWTIILRFQIQEIVIQVDEDDEDGEKRSAKDALLLWCQRKTAGYPGVHIENFTSSWRNGLGFNALIHAHRPDLIDYDRLQPEEHMHNLNNAFEAAEKHLGIAQILDPEDVDVNRPDDKVILVYVASYYHYFAKMKSEMTGGRRVAKVMGQMMDIERQMDNYETMTSELLAWIESKVDQLNDRNFPNSLEGIQKELIRFKQYRTVEKPPKYTEKGSIEVQYFNIQAKLKANGQRQYIPPEGKLVHDIEKAWSGLEKAEHGREVALREELIRQERLEQLAQRFHRKAAIRESWLTDMSLILAENLMCNNAAQTDAAIKKHEAISAEILARKDRFKALSQLAKELVQGNYHSKGDIDKRDEEILRKWKELLVDLENRKVLLSGFKSLTSMFREIDSIQEELKEVESKLKVEDCGKHLQATEDYIQKHSLVDTQLEALTKRARNLNRRSVQQFAVGSKEGAFLDKSLQDLNTDLKRVEDKNKKRKANLEEARLYYEFLRDSEEEERWLNEKLSNVKSTNSGKDLTAALKLLKKHDALEDEIQSHAPICDQVCNVGQNLIKHNHDDKKQIKHRIDNLKGKWQLLRDLAKIRRTLLDDAVEAQQYYADANEVDSWIREKMPLVCSDDYGRDEANAQALLSRYNRLEEEIKAFHSEIKRLDELVALMTKAAHEHNISPTKFLPVENGEQVNGEFEYEEEIIQVPKEVEVEETIEREVMKEFVEKQEVPQIKALYAYQGHGMKIAKGEILQLMQKSNDEWWQCRQSEGIEGFIPANYVKEIDPVIIQKVVKHPVKVPQKVKVKKTIMTKEVVQKKRTPNIRRAPSVRSPSNLHYDKDNVESRQTTVRLSYGKLVKLGKTRRISLEDAIRLFKFYRECDEFETWMIDKEQVLQRRESLADNMEAVRKKFQKLLTSMAANKGRLDTINQLADDIVKSGSSKRDHVRKRQKEINDRWANLNRLKKERERSLQGASSIELFQSTCDELQDWMKEKKDGMMDSDVGKDLEANEKLQRKHANLERELVPVEEKIKRMNYLADEVKSSYPDEMRYVDQRQGDVLAQWKGLQDDTAARKAQLDEAEDLYKFHDDAKHLLSWAGNVRARLSSEELPRDVQTAEVMLKDLEDISEDINDNKEKFKKLRNLGNKILRKDPKAKDVQEKQSRLRAEEKGLDDLLQKRRKQLQDAYNLQLFNREADQIDAATSSQEAFLEYSDTGKGVDDVQKLIKQHEDFERNLQMQEDKVKGLCDLGNKLIKDDHPNSDHMDKRMAQVLERREKIKDKAKGRQDALKDSLEFQEFKRDANELSSWMNEKYKTATDESYRDMTNLENKMQKHQAFEAELKANNERLNEINKMGKKKIAEKHPQSKNIGLILDDVNAQWDELYDRSVDKGNKLQQAIQAKALNRAIEDAQAKLDEIEKNVASDDVGSDLRSVKDLINKHQMVETDFLVLSDNIGEIVAQGHAMSDAGHFDSPAITKSVDNVSRRFERLKPAVVRRKQKLQDSLKWHQFNFDADSELQWIKEHLPSATSTDYGKSLVDAQNLNKKHQKFMQECQGHQPGIEKVLDHGGHLIEERHFAAKPIKDKCQQVQVAWDDLLDKGKKRKRGMDMHLLLQQYLSEVAEVEGWIGEKKNIASSTDYGKDEVMANKLLTRHKALETDINTYNNIVTNLSKEATRLIKGGNGDPTFIKKTQEKLQDQMNSLKRAAGDRHANLEHSHNVHQYVRESGDLEEWINEQMQTASSEEYGQDYEHLLDIRNRFDEFKRKVDAGSQRFHRCERLATDIVESKSPYGDQVKERHEQLSEAWNTLLEHIDARDQKLVGAGEIHRFNKDVEEALTRIQEKYSSIPEDLGRDINATQSYLTRHEGFENELVALEAQLQVLIDDSARLQATYPGENAEQIEQLQVTVVENWGILQDRASLRKDELLAQADLHRFNSSVRELLSWAHEIEREMLTEHQVRDVQSVEILKTRHNELKAEIEARDDTFNAVVQAGEQMILNGHFASDEIKDKVEQVLGVREKLRHTWLSRMSQIDQIHELQVFLRDANQLDTISHSQEAYLGSSDYGTDVEQVNGLIKRHEAFEKLLTTQDEKLSSLKDHGQELIQSNRHDNPKIEETLYNVSTRRSKVKDQSVDRKKKLDDSKLYAQFQRDVVETEGWLDDKLKVAYEDNFRDVTDLYDKMKKLQKHQAFESEIMANEDRIKTIKELGDLLLRKKHPSSENIRTSLTRLLGKWKELLRASANRGRGLEEARDILEFHEQVDKVEMWMREKEMLVNASDLGRDYEHCFELQKKVNNQESAGITVDEQRIQSINVLADKLITKGQSDTRAVKERRNDLNNTWHALQGNLTMYKAKLAAALEIHSFNRDVDDLNDRINEKQHMVSNDDLGRDLAGVQALQRKQEAIERDMTALQNQLEKIETQASKLCKKYPDLKESIKSKQQEVTENWDKLEESADIRKKRLAASYQHQKCVSDARELMTWSSEMIKRMESGELAKDVTEAENMLQINNERKAEIDGRQSDYATCREHGKNLVNENHYAAGDVQKVLKQLEQSRSNLVVSWEKRRYLLTQCHNLQMFKETADQTEAWLASKEAFLANDDAGGSLSSVEALVKSHEQFEKTLRAQEDKVEELRQFATDLCSEDHYATEEITTRSLQVTDRCNRLWETSSARKKKLEDSHNYQIFLKNMYEVSGWVSDKMKVALDESFRDPTNLQSKLQKHQAFEAEVTANRNRVESVNEEGTELIEADHYAKSEIKKRLQELETSWEALVAASTEKREKLQDAYQAMLFLRVVEDLNNWMEDVEHQLMSEDHGKDLTSVTSLLKKHQLLEQDISSHQEKVQDVVNSAQVFKDNRHFMYKELQSTSKKVQERYASLSEPCHIRRDNLEDAQLMYQFYRDLEDEMSWVGDKMPLADSKELGHSLSSAQEQVKNHATLESEILAHEPLIDSVSITSQQMIKKEHFASAEIRTRMNELSSQLQLLKDRAMSRRLKLQESVKVQKFYSECYQAESWMKEKKPLMTSSDLGKDEDSVMVLMKKLDALERDIDNYSSTIGELSALSRSLADKEHYDTKNILQYQSQLEQQYSDLHDLTSKRRDKLNDSKKLYEFYREADDTSFWMSEKGTIAASEDYGTDLEHVEVLQQKFEDFIRELHTGEERIMSLRHRSETMIRNNHYESDGIKAKIKDVNQMWADLNDVTQARQEALAGAKQVHMYGRDADDTLNWIQEKDIVVSSEDFGHDLESVQSLVSWHYGLERDLAAISEQVESITKEAERLIGLFPDAQEHIAARHEEMVHAWNQLVEKATSRKDKLQQAEQLQMYFDEYRELSAWCNEMTAVITADDLAHDLPGAELQVSRHKEHKDEIDSHQDRFTKFNQTGHLLIKNGHFLSTEIAGKIRQLDDYWDALLRVWDQRRELYDQNLEAQHFKYEMDQLDAWMGYREPMLKEAYYGDSIEGVNELIRRQADFEKTLSAQEEKFDSIKKRIQIEQAFLDQKEIERRQIEEDDARREKDRVEEIRRKEQERILEERRREEEQRKAKEVLLRRQMSREGQSSSESDEDKKPREDSDKQLGTSVVKNLIGRSQTFKVSPMVTQAGGREVKRSLSFKNNEQASASPVNLSKAADFRKAATVDMPDGEMVQVEARGDASSAPPQSVIPTKELEVAPAVTLSVVSATPTATQPEVHIEQKKQDDIKLPVVKPSSPVSAHAAAYDKKEALKPTSPSHKRRLDDLRSEEKKSKRTPSFTMHRKTRSFKDKYKLPTGLPAAEISGILDRKQQLQVGGKKAAIRSWKTYYSVLCGQLLCFFKDKDGFMDSNSAAPPLNVHNAHCEIARDYTKKKNVIRLKLSDGAEFLFEAPSQDQMVDWYSRINMLASLEPSEAIKYSTHAPGSPSSDHEDAVPSHDLSRVSENVNERSVSMRSDVSDHSTSSLERVGQRDNSPTKSTGNQSFNNNDGHDKMESHNVNAMDEEDAPPLPLTRPPPTAPAAAAAGKTDSDDSSSDENDDNQMRDKSGSTSKRRPHSDTSGTSSPDHDKDKQKKRKSMFGFLRGSKKDKEPHQKEKKDKSHHHHHHQQQQQQ